MSSQIKYCLPIFSASFEKAKELVTNYSHEYYYFEFWLEYFQEPENVAKYFAEKLGERAIFLFRRLKLEAPVFDKNLKESLFKIISNYHSYVDFDFRSQKQDLENFIKLKGKAKLITSFHNYDLTPSAKELESIITTMKSYSPDIYKVACFCEQEVDALSLLNLRLYCNNLEMPAIVLGMGAHGVITRLFCTLWGNKMIFAPIDRSLQSAPEQLCLEELKQCFDVLTGKGLRQIN